MCVFLLFRSAIYVPLVLIDLVLPSRGVGCKDGGIKGRGGRGRGHVVFGFYRLHYKECSGWVSLVWGKLQDGGGQREPFGPLNLVFGSR